MSSLQNTRIPLEAGEFYHIFNRGNAGQIIFPKEKNYPHFLNRLKDYMDNYWQFYAYALLPNHFHLMIKVKQEKQLIEAASQDFKKVSRLFLNKFALTDYAEKHPDLLNFKNLVNLVLHDSKNYHQLFYKHTPSIFYEKLLHWVVSERFRRFSLSYAKGIREQEGGNGSLFQKLFRRKLLDHQSYRTQLVLYLHRNLIHHGKAGDLSEKGWTSYYSMLSEKPTRLRRDEVLKWFDGKDNFQKLHETYVDEWKDRQKWLIEEDEDLPNLKGIVI